MNAKEPDVLREEIAQLGQLLGQTIQQFAGPESLQLVEGIRVLSRGRRQGDQESEKQLCELIATLDDDKLRIVIRAFSIFLDLANLAEDRQRVRVLRRRTAERYPRARQESIEAALVRLKEDGASPDQMQRLLDQLHIELVFTAHPTEAKRRSVRSKLRRIRHLLDEADRGLHPGETDRNRQAIRAELAKLWLTDFIRPWRPTVLQEVQRGLSFKPVLWNMAPQILAETRAALATVYPNHAFDVGPCVTFGSWIGGDRDGHPYVTTDVTRQTILWLRQAALEFHLASCRDLFDSLSLSRRQMPDGRTLQQRLAEALESWPQLEDEMRDVPPNEVFRRWLAALRWRLQQTAQAKLDGFAPGGAYLSAASLQADVNQLLEAIREGTGSELLAAEVAAWLDQIRIFGFHLARLDIRQDSRQYAAVVDELLEQSKLCKDAAALDEGERQKLLVGSLRQPAAVDETNLSEDARETLALFRLLRRVVRAFGAEALGGHVVSMTHAPSDVLAVLWLWHHAGAAQQLCPLPLIPLFETIDDLRHSHEVLAALLRTPAYREHLSRQGDQQIVMLGYSDSTKDGGYLSACWSLFRAQQQLQELAGREQIELTFFHGRGGSLGRGGGPAARSILSLPRASFHGSLRLTEQGEVLADRYDDPRIAQRHMEQVLWSSLLAGGMAAPEIPQDWLECIQRLAADSFQAYRRLIEQPGFVDFFRRVTPISEIEQMPIGSRPARRRGGSQLSDLRAIPWVFSWTQSRCLVPAWYGLGEALQDSLQDAGQLDRLRSMYRLWPFFRATIDNAELALAKTDLGIAERYADLADDSATLSQIGDLIAGEFTRSRCAVLAITDCDDLLDNIPWLKESIRVRNRYIDPLNLIQIELMRRLQASDAAGEEELRHLMRLTIKGLAAGMRTTG